MKGLKTSRAEVQLWRGRHHEGSHVRIVLGLGGGSKLDTDAIPMDLDPIPGLFLLCMQALQIMI